MPDYEILWAPLSRKWQVWQRESDSSGCIVETLIGEYPSEGRASHEVAVLQGEIPAGSIYETPRQRRWFSLINFLPSKRTEDSSSEPAEIVDEPPSTNPPEKSTIEKTAAADFIEPGSGQPNYEQTEWRSGLIAKLELVRRSAERDEVESIRQMLCEALLVIPNDEQHVA